MFLPLFSVQLGTMSGDAWLAVFLYIAVFVFAWARKNLGDTRPAILFTLIIMTVIFAQHEIIIWVIAGIYLFSTYGKEVFKL